mgnify:FL=1
MILFDRGFIIFTIIIISLYYTFLRNYQWQLLLAGSLFFYIYFTGSYFILFSIVNTFIFGLAISKAERSALKKRLLIGCL